MPPKARDYARQVALGYNVKSFRKHKPEIARAYDLYVECRNQVLFSAEITKGKKTSLRVVHHTTGYAALPITGGMLDQPYRLMEFWSYFLEGDRLATFKNLS